MIYLIVLLLSVQGTTYASWYGPGFEGRPTANGEVFNPEELTCASPKLPFNTKLKVTNLANGKSVVVRVNDRGPFSMDESGRALRPLIPHETRGLDLSKKAFETIADLDIGIIYIKYEIL